MCVGTDEGRGRHATAQMRATAMCNSTDEEMGTRTCRFVPVLSLRVQHQQQVVGHELRTHQSFSWDRQPMQACNTASPVGWALEDRLSKTVHEVDDGHEVNKALFLTAGVTEPSYDRLSN